MMATKYFRSLLTQTTQDCTISLLCEPWPVYEQYCDYTLCIITRGTKIAQKCCQNVRLKVLKVLKQQSALFPHAILQHQPHTETMAAAPSPITHTHRVHGSCPLTYHTHTHRVHGSCPLTYHTHKDHGSCRSPVFSGRFSAGALAQRYRWPSCWLHQSPSHRRKRPHGVLVGCLHWTPTRREPVGGKQISVCTQDQLSWDQLPRDQLPCDQFLQEQLSWSQLS